jgi:hypothetical protein
MTDISSCEGLLDLDISDQKKCRRFKEKVLIILEETG